jgi:hypothetical protein
LNGGLPHGVPITTCCSCHASSQPTHRCHSHLLPLNCCPRANTAKAAIVSFLWPLSTTLSSAASCFSSLLLQAWDIKHQNDAAVVHIFPELPPQHLLTPRCPRACAQPHPISMLQAMLARSRLTDRASQPWSKSWPRGDELPVLRACLPSKQSSQV